MKKTNQRQPWEGKYSLEVKLNLPTQFNMLCLLTSVTPECVLHDFMNTMGMESYGKGKEQQQLLMQYFMTNGYGQEHYSTEEIRAIFYELTAVGTLWPANADSKLIDTHSEWRKEYFRFWFGKWWNKLRKASQ